jgi:ABC-type sugar transport system substrate-binding protein
MAMGARKAFVDRTEKDRKQWLSIPFTGCDGVTKTAQDWVQRGLLKATIITAPAAGTALAILAKAVNAGSMPPERTLIPPRSFPAIERLSAKAQKASGQRWAEDSSHPLATTLVTNHCHSLRHLRHVHVKAGLRQQRR